MIEFQKTLLSNGLRVLTSAQHETKAMTLLVFVGTGSRFETPEINGISHFLEHILFKGTEKYPSPLALAEILDGIGANFNAYTSQEYTGFYVQAEASHFPLALEVLYEMFYRPRYAHEDIEREKGVIVEEINMYRDLPQRHVGDLIFELMYGTTPMGRNIAGTAETVRSFSKETFEAYQQAFYTPDNMIVSVAGHPQHFEWLKGIEQCFGSHTGARARNFEPAQFAQHQSRVLVEQRQTDQTHLVLAVPGLKETDPRWAQVSVLNTILGGSMSSRLFTEIREQRGLAYYVRSSHDTFHDTGVFGISSGIRNAEVKTALGVILAELKKLKLEQVTEKELKRAKENFAGRLALGLEGSSETSSYLAQRELYEGTIIQPEELAEQINAVTRAQVQSMAQHLFNSNTLNLAAIGPFKEDELLPVLNGSLE